MQSPKSVGSTPSILPSTLQGRSPEVTARAAANSAREIPPPCPALISKKRRNCAGSKRTCNGSRGATPHSSRCAVARSGTLSAVSMPLTNSADSRSRREKKRASPSPWKFMRTGAQSCDASLSSPIGEICTNPPRKTACSNTAPGCFARTIASPSCMAKTACKRKSSIP